jgi:hypothetical protein
MVLPNGRADTIRFFEVHLPGWAVDHAALGLSQAEIEELQALAAEARDALAAAEHARIAAKAATLGLHNRADALRRRGQLAIDRIRATAAATGNPLVFAAAEIDPPRFPQRRGAPGKPTHLRMSIDATGVLTLTWKSTNSKPSTGAMFSVSRQVVCAVDPAGADPPFENLGAVPARTFTDSSVPPGATMITYQVQGRRGPHEGDAALFTVRLSGPRARVPAQAAAPAAPATTVPRAAHRAA